MKHSRAAATLLALFLFGPGSVAAWAQGLRLATFNTHLVSPAFKKEITDS